MYIYIYINIDINVNTGDQQYRMAVNISNAGVKHK